MADLFNAIVLLFNSICRSAGFSKYELNILVSASLIPALICLLLWFVQKRWLTGLHGLLIAENLTWHLCVWEKF